MDATLLSRARPLSRQARRTLVALIVSGIAMRLAWVAQTAGLPFDMESLRQVAASLGSDPLNLYGDINDERSYRWPYPPGYLPWVAVSDWLAGHGIVSFRAAVVLPAVVADGAIAWLVQAALGRSGASERARLGAAAAVVLGPSFALISGYHGQIDSVAILPAIVALLVWERAGPRRALIAGLLIGLAASVKTAPGLVLLALLPTVVSRREAATLIGAAIAVPLAMLAPFLVADSAGVATALGYSGIPGQGGITMLANPDLAKYWVANDRTVMPNGVVAFLMDHGSLMTGAALLAVGAFAFRRRMGPRDAAVLLWLAFFAFGTAFAFQYVIWGLPFLLLAGRLRWVVAAQVALLVPSLMRHAGPFKDPLFTKVYIVLMACVWMAAVAAFAVTLRQARRVAVTA